jgi:hypothetical protein
MGFVDNTHAALTQTLEDLVVGNGLSDHRSVARWDATAEAGCKRESKTHARLGLRIAPSARLAHVLKAT